MPRTGPHRHFEHLFHGDRNKIGRVINSEQGRASQLNFTVRTVGYEEYPQAQIGRFIVLFMITAFLLASA